MRQGGVDTKEENSDRCSMTDHGRLETPTGLEVEGEVAGLWGVDVHRLARLHLLRNNWFWPNGLNKHPSTPRLTRVSKL